MRAAAGLATAMMLAAGVAQTQEIPYQPQTLPAPGVTACPGGLCGVDGLVPLFEALKATETGARHAPVHIVQIGDSHTAGDRITGAVRAALQARFGHGGRGVLSAGVPHAGYAPYQVQVTAQDWSVSTAPLTPRGGFARADVGLAGIMPPAYGRAPGLTLTFEPGAEPTELHLCGRGGPQADGFQVAVGQRMLSLSLRAGQVGPLCRWLNLHQAAGVLELRAEGRGPLAYSLSVRRDGPGVMVSNLGVVGATLRDLAARDQAVVAAELADWRPSLIVLAFGTNEGFEDDLDPAAYEALLRDQIARLRRMSPVSGLLILGAPDALRTGAPNPCSADGRRAPPPSLAVVRDVQRRVAADTGVAYWDWQGRMGGDCASDRLATMAEPLMRGDRVHFTSAGADWIGGVLSADLMAAYDAWKGEER